MTKVMELDIVSAESSIFTGDVSFVSVTGAMGEIGIHPGHMPLLTSLKPGQIHVKMPDGQEQIFYMSGGMLEIQPTVVSVLADTAFRADDLDEAAAKTAKAHAEKILNEQAAGIEYSKALCELAEAAAQLRAITLYRERLKNIH